MNSYLLIFRLIKNFSNIIISLAIASGDSQKPPTEFRRSAPVVVQMNTFMGAWIDLLTFFQIFSWNFSVFPFLLFLIPKKFFLLSSCFNTATSCHYSTTKHLHIHSSSTNPSVSAHTYLKKKKRTLDFIHLKKSLFSFVLLLLPRLLLPFLITSDSLCYFISQDIIYYVH